MGLASRTPAGAPPLQRKPGGSVAAPGPNQADPVEDWMRVALRPDLHQTPILRKSAREIGYAETGRGAPPSTTGTTGRPLPTAVQAKMEDAYASDFSAVRVHEGEHVTAMGALAFTQSSDIHFAPGQYDPGSQRGQELLGHELAHVVQQGEGRVQATTQAKGMAINDDASLEQEADDQGRRAARGESVRDGAHGPLARSSGQPVVQGYFTTDEQQSPNIEIAAVRHYVHHVRPELRGEFESTVADHAHPVDLHDWVQAKLNLRMNDIYDWEDGLQAMETDAPDPHQGGAVPSTSSQPPQHQVISGHGRFNENYLESSGRRSKSATFKVPADVTIKMYTPDGAALDNAVANHIETGGTVSAGDVEMAMNDGASVQPVPTPYPRVFAAGADVINYTVTPPDRLSVSGAPYVVTAPKSLKTIVDELSGNGRIEIHYACCGSGFSDKAAFRDLFPGRGWYVRFKR
jgi:hypothetical protein